MTGIPKHMIEQAAHRPLRARRVDECDTLDEIFRDCLPAFGGAFLRRIYTILDRAIGEGYPLTMSISGPVTVSGQHITWLIPLLETGWIAYLSTTDAVCYHDGHRSLDAHGHNPFHEVAIFGDDAQLRDDQIIRVTDIGFPEEVLYDQDRFLSACFQLPEFQKKMTGTEMRYRLGALYAAQERKSRAPHGLLTTCHRLAVPIFVGAPADGSVFLNSMKLWAMQKAGMVDSYKFDLDLHAEVFEACAYHRWGLFESSAKGLATFILGGGVPKNYNLQPEPALGQRDHGRGHCRQPYRRPGPAGLGVPGHGPDDRDQAEGGDALGQRVLQAGRELVAGQRAHHLHPVGAYPRRRGENGQAGDPGDRVPDGRGQRPAGPGGDGSPRAV